MEDPYDLERFVIAQDAGGTYWHALAELRSGMKRSHWMWFVFPQLAGLGRSETARKYAISSLDEARAYIRHDVLGPRLREVAAAVAFLEGRSAVQIFGSIDARKLHSSMTLFGLAAPGESAFRDVLDRYFDGREDAATGQLLEGQLPEEQPGDPDKSGGPEQADG
ncbi:Uncharacterized protein, DUF1810 family [Arthrobacter sp. ov407]|uniref:DUF1810 domain-containing protein n=1 Tax=Arthrobacter sp. ov407 TaxID=1761748 RepID=UPI00088E8488|nr:DUF1810 domain-containing protein [Arthrobacter sp. ov407]SDK47069.1 Uncharacterized protein, DUF1810 family [Arthrobacter sp. ov407]